jgi:hypothetical protein
MANLRREAMFLVNLEMPLSHAGLDAVGAVIDDQVKSSL